MKKQIFFLIMVGTIAICKGQNNESKSHRSNVIIEMINAVNEKDPKKYAKDFDEDVEIFVKNIKKVEGKNSLIINRTEHFKKHPDIRSEIQHLVEIDNKVVLHDKVWLNKSDRKGKNIVEIFTFKNGKIIRVNVIQPKNLFKE